MKPPEALFKELAAINSPSGQEGKAVEYLRQLFAKEFSAHGVFSVENVPYRNKGMQGTAVQCRMDFSATAVDIPEVVFCAHLDTVPIACGANPCISADGETFFSSENTALGADDKAGVAAIMYGIAQALTKPHGRITAFFSCMEEWGAKGAQYAFLESPAPVKADYCFVLDGNAPALTYGIGAEYAYSYNIRYTATANVIVEASTLLAALPYQNSARLCAEPKRLITKDNVAAFVYSVSGSDKSMVTAAARTAEELFDNQKQKGKLIYAKNEAEGYTLSEEKAESIVSLFIKAASTLGTPLLKPQKGCSDASAAAKAGITVLLLGSGAKAAHTENESISVMDIRINAKLVENLCTELAKQAPQK